MSLVADHTRRDVYELSFGSSGPHVRVVSFTGKEQLSRPFRFEVTVAVSLEDAGRLAADVLGGPAALTLSTRGGTRDIRGVVSRVTALAVDPEKHLSWCTVRLVPRLWTLGLRRTSRIFQERTVPEIVTEVLDGAGVAHTWRLAGQHGTRPYSVQYQETDLDYVSRLLAEEGIFYFFEDARQEGRSEVVVLADLAAHYPAIAGNAVLPFAPPSDQVTTGEAIESFSPRDQVRTGASRVKNFDSRRPDTDLSSVAATRSPQRILETSLEVYEYDFAAEDDDAVAGAAARRLEQLRVRKQICFGRSRSSRLSVGRRFVLDGHPGEGVSGEYAVLKVTHEGRVPESTFGLSAGGQVEVYKNTFECLPAAVAARPPRRRRRTQQVLETATVVGPVGEEIHTDEHGRIKVQFHWDRRGRRDEDSSCWIRCMQTWAGAAWGTQFVPRIGMEVLVSFVGGDVDQPMVIGCAYNGTHPPPFPLPANKTKSGIRTRSTPGGAGSNELSFEDAAGKEQIYLHAQRDLEQVVENDHRRLVRGDEEILVQGTRESIVAGDHHRQVRGNEVVTIEKDLLLHVVGRQRIVIEGRVPQADGPVEGEQDVGAASPAPTLVQPAVAAAAPLVTGWPAVDHAAEELAHAKLVWATASLPEELQAPGAEIEQHVTALALRIGKLRGDVESWPARGRPADGIDALRSSAVEVRTGVLHAMVEAGMAVDERMAKLRDAAQERLMSALLETQRAQIALVGGDPSRAALPTAGARGGVGRGGGGALPTTTDKQKLDFEIESADMRANVPFKVTTDDGSVMEFTTGGKIVSPVAFAIEVGSTKLTMTPAGIEIHAPLISLQSSGEIHVTASGNVLVKGALITLN